MFLLLHLEDLISYLVWDLEFPNLELLDQMQQQQTELRHLGSHWHHLSTITSYCYHPEVSFFFQFLSWGQPASLRVLIQTFWCSQGLRYLLCYSNKLSRLIACSNFCVSESIISEHLQGLSHPLMVCLRGPHQLSFLLPQLPFTLPLFWWGWSIDQHHIYFWQQESEHIYTCS